MKRLNLKWMIGIFYFLLASPVFSQQAGSDTIDFVKETISSELKCFEQNANGLVKNKTCWRIASFVSTPKAIPLSIDSINHFITFAAVWDDTALISQNQCTHKHNYKASYVLAFRTSANTEEWSSWDTIALDEHAAALNWKNSSKLYFLDKEDRYYQYKITMYNSHLAISKIRFDFFTPNYTVDNNKNNLLNKKHSLNSSSSCPCPQPNYTTRTGWSCPQGQSSGWTPQTTAVTHFIVHHTDHPQASAPYSAIVLSIWNHHTYTNQWGDIGYNWLVDPNGVIYEGRAGGNNIIGAHFCAQNSGTMGVAMIGNFTSSTPTTAAKNTLVELLGWRACDLGISPTTSSYHSGSGVTLNHIAGHRADCSTSCPGTQFYNTFPTLRSDVANYINNCGNTLSPPTIISPAQNSTNVSIPVNFDWTSVSGATAYRISVSTSPNGFDPTATLMFPNPVLDQNTGTTTSYTWTGAQPNTTYYWAVRAHVPNVGQSVTTVHTFTTGSGGGSSSCDDPTNLHVDNVTGSSCKLDWYPPSSGTPSGGYYFRYKKVSSGSWITGTASSSYENISGLDCGEAYEFEVRSDCGSNGNGSWIGPFTFNTSACPCTAPTNPYSTATTSTSSYVVWGSGSAGTYEVAYQEDGASLWTTITVNSTNKQLTGLSCGTIYNYRVRTVCGTGVYSAWTTVKSLTTTACPCAAPTNPYSTATTSTSSYVVWGAGSAGTYEVEYQEDGASLWTTITVNSTNKQLTGLSCGTIYNYRIRTVCATGVYSAWTTIKSLTTTACPCGAPQNPYSTATTSTTSYVVWAAPSSGVPSGGYELIYRENGASVWTTIVVSGTYKQLTGLSCGTNYEYKVRAVCGTGVYGSWTTVKSFTTTVCPCAAPTNPYSTATTSSSSYVVWGAGSAGTYEVEYQEDGASIWTKITVNGTNKQLTGLSCGKSYNYRVRTVCGTGVYSVWTTIKSLTTTACQTVMISGYVQTSSGQPITNTVININGSGLNVNTTTNGAGYYYYSINVGWSGNITVSKTGYNFSPSYYSYTNVSGAYSNKNYIGSVVSGSLPVADFYAGQTTGNIPMVANFFDLSTNNPSNWEWTFYGASPSTSTLQNPIVVYSSTGTYAVKLKVSNIHGSDSIVKVSYITVGSSTAVAEIESNDIKIYPNPTSGLLNIDLDKKYSSVLVKVYNTLGQLVQEFEQEDSDSATLYLSVGTGVYILEVYSDDKRLKKQKVVKY